MSLETFEVEVSTNKNKIEITILSNETILDEKLSMFSVDETSQEIDFQIVDKFVKEFNRVSQSAIENYNFELTNKKTLNVCILLKHFFKKFDEKQIYLPYKVSYNEIDKSCLLIRTTKKIDVKCPSSSIASPFSEILLKNEKTDNELNKTTISLTSDYDIESFKNYDLIMTFTKKMLLANYNNLNNYISLSK